MIIHLIAPKDKTKWHGSWHHCYKSWKDCPYKIKMWSDSDVDNLLKEDDKEFFEILNTLPSIYKWDYVRYVILEKFGGAYFDMDVEIIDGSFFKMIPSNKMLFMEGTSGTYLENSIMITPINLLFRKYWKGLKHNAQYSIKNTPKSDLIYQNVVFKVGAGLISKFFLDRLLNVPEERHWEILGYHQFGCPNNNGITFTKHYHSSIWSP